MSFQNRLMIFTLGTCVVSGSALADASIQSREYKLALDPSHFTAATEAAQVDSYFTALQGAVTAAISRDVTGAMTLDKVRTVRFYDTAGSCPLKALGYIFRERVENGYSEVTLKFRSPDRYIASFEDLSATSSQAETKLEADIGATASDPFKVVYSHSTKAPNTRTINNFADINSHFPGFESDYGFSDSQTLALVGNLNIIEHLYSGGIIDLGSIDAEVSVTLWYANTASGTPVIAEASFKYADSSSEYTRKVVNRGQQAFIAMQGLTAWNASSASGKTQAVYQYNPSFCN